MSLAGSAMLVLALGAAGATTAAVAEPRHLEGTWGGDQVRVAASAADVEIQIVCLRGRADEAVTLDGAGAFTIAVRLLPLQGMHLQDDDVRAPATVRGRVRGDELRLEIGPAGTQGAGTYVLTRGRKATLPDCRRRG